MNMKQIRIEVPSLENSVVSLHDKVITEIVCKETHVDFHFAKGFDVIDGATVVPTKIGYVRFEQCDSEDFDCYIIKRWPTSKGLKLRGRQISLKKLSFLLKEKKASIEVYLELYDFNHTYFRGELLPTKSTAFRRLAPLVIIETMDFFPMTYTWEI